MEHKETQDATSDNIRLSETEYTSRKERPSSAISALALSYRNSMDAPLLHDKTNPEDSTPNLVRNTCVTLPVQDNENTLDKLPLKSTETGCSCSCHLNSNAPTACKSDDTGMYLLLKREHGEERADYFAKEFNFNIDEAARNMTYEEWFYEPNYNPHGEQPNAGLQRGARWHETFAARCNMTTVRSRLRCKDLLDCHFIRRAARSLPSFPRKYGKRGTPFIRRQISERRCRASSDENKFPALCLKEHLGYPTLDFSGFHEAKRNESPLQGLVGLRR